MNDLTPLYTFFPLRIKILQYHHIVNIVTVKNLSNVARAQKAKKKKKKKKIRRREMKFLAKLKL